MFYFGYYFYPFLFSILLQIIRGHNDLFFYAPPNFPPNPTFHPSHLAHLGFLFSIFHAHWAQVVLSCKERSY